MNETRFEIYDSIKEIKESEWNALLGDVPEGYYFYKSLEEARLEEFEFHYVVLRRGDQILLVVPLFIGRLNLDMTITGFAKSVIASIRRFLPNFFTVKTLFCGSPFGENGVIGFATGLPPQETEVLVSSLVQNLERFCREKKISFLVFKDFEEKNDAILRRPLCAASFSRIDSFPSAGLRINFHSMDEYFKKLSYATRKSFRRKLKQINMDEVRIEVVEDIRDILEDIYRLYLNNYNRGKVKFERLTKDFFKAISENFRPQAKFFLYFIKDRLRAFNLCFVHRKVFIDKFIGFDYEVSNTYHLYQLSWYQNVKWCLENSMEYYQVGQTDYAPKTTLGGELVPLYAYFKHLHPVSNFFLKTLAKLLKL